MLDKDTWLKLNHNLCYDEEYDSLQSRAAADPNLDLVSKGVISEFFAQEHSTFQFKEIECQDPDTEETIRKSIERLIEAGYILALSPEAIEVHPYALDDFMYNTNNLQTFSVRVAADQQDMAQASVLHAIVQHCILEDEGDHLTYKLNKKLLREKFSYFTPTKIETSIKRLVEAGYLERVKKGTVKVTEKARLAYMQDAYTQEAA